MTEQDNRVPAGALSRHKCTSTDPWSSDRATHASHPDAKYLHTRERDGMDYDVYECPHCETRFEECCPR